MMKGDVFFKTYTKELLKAELNELAEAYSVTICLTYSFYTPQWQVRYMMCKK